MRTVEEALELAAAAAAATLGARREPVALRAACGRVLADDVRMDHDVPPFDRALMDGYALQRADRAAGRTLRCVRAVHAGDASGPPLEAGTCVAIMTGAPLPTGAEVVLPLEWIEAGKDEITIRELPLDTDYVALRGSHVRADAVIVPRRTCLAPGHVGSLAAAGAATVSVYARPRVAILGTGSELVDVAETPGPTQIRNSNAPALRAQLEAAGAEVTDLGIAADDRETLARAVARGLEQDLLLLSGGVSKGAKDYVPAVLAEAGVEEVFHRWAVQPGGPLWFGKTATTLVVGLPGNPQATFVGCELLVVPLLAALYEAPVRARPLRKARYVGDWGRAMPRRRFRPVRVSTDAEGTLVAEALPWRGSGDLFVLAAAEGLAILPEHATGPAASGLVDLLPLARPLQPGGDA